MRKRNVAPVVALLVGFNTAPASALEPSQPLAAIAAQADAGSLSAPSSVWTSNDGGKTKVHWDAVDEAIVYNVYRNGDYAETVHGTSWTDDWDPWGYTYTVVTVSNDQQSPHSHSVTGLPQAGAQPAEPAEPAEPEAQPEPEQQPEPQAQVEQPAERQPEDEPLPEAQVAQAVEPQPQPAPAPAPAESIQALAAPGSVWTSNDGGKTKVHWGTVENATAYDVYRNGDYARTITGTSWTDDWDPWGYTYTVVTVSNDQQSPHSHPVTGLPRPDAQPTAPAQPEAVAASDGTSLPEVAADDPAPTANAVPDQNSDSQNSDSQDANVVATDAPITVSEVDPAPETPVGVATPEPEPEPTPEPEPSELQPDPTAVIRDDDEVEEVATDEDGDGPEPPEPSTDAQSDAPVIVREDDELEEDAADDDTDGGGDGPDPTVGEGDYGGEQGGDIGAVPEDATGGADNSNTQAPLTGSDSGIDVNQTTTDAVTNTDNTDAGTLSTTQVTNGPSIDLVIVEGGAGRTESTAEQVVHNADGTSTVTDQQTTDLTVSGGANIGIAGVEVEAGLTDTHIVELSGPTDVVQAEAADGTIPDTSDVTAVSVGSTVTEIGNPGLDLFDSGTTETATGNLGPDIDINLPGPGPDLEIAAGVNGSVTHTSQEDLDTTVVTNNGDELVVGTGSTDLEETTITLNPQVGATLEGNNGGNIGGTASTTTSATFTSQDTDTIVVAHPNTPDGQAAAQQQADTDEVTLPADGEYDITNQQTTTLIQTQSPVAVEGSIGNAEIAIGTPTVTNVEVEQQTNTTHMQGESGGEPATSILDLIFNPDEVLGQSSNHTVTESVDDGEPGFAVGQSSDGRPPLAQPIVTVTATTTDGIAIEMTPEELQVNAEIAVATNPHNPVLTDLSNGVPLPQAVHNDATRPGEMMTIGHDNTNTLDALEAVANQAAASNPPAQTTTTEPTTDEVTYDPFGDVVTTPTTTNDNTTDDDDEEEEDDEVTYDPFGDVVNNNDDDDGGSDSDSRVICTYFYKLGELDRADWVADMRFTQENISTQTVRGYHAWGIPTVRLMRSKSLLGRAIQPFMRYIAVHRAAELAYQMGRSDTPDFAGKVVRATMEPMCWFIGAFANEQNWQGLYNRDYQPTRVSINEVSV